MAGDQQTALLLIDWINEIVHSDGKFAAHGYPEFVASNRTAERVATALTLARSKGWLVAHVRVAFAPGYEDHPASSPLMGAARQYGALRDGEWGTQFHDAFQPGPGEPVVTKKRVNAFYGTDLDLLLRAQGVNDLIIAGVATDLAVQSTARDGHDRDYQVTVLADACAAANEDDHRSALATLGKVCAVLTTPDLPQ